MIFFNLPGDFNSEPCEHMRDFFHVYNYQNIIKDKTRFEASRNTPYIDLVVTNRRKSFLKSTVCLISKKIM